MKAAERLLLAGLIFVVGYLLFVNAAAFIIAFIFSFIYRIQIGPMTGTLARQGKDPYIATASVLIAVGLSAFVTHRIYRRCWPKMATEPVPKNR